MNFTRKFRGLLLSRLTWLLCACIFLTTQNVAQTTSDLGLLKMPPDLETDLALSALPPHLRAGATVYLLDPAKGYYVGRQGTNGFVCFIDRTDWEWGVYKNDVAMPMGYDAEGARTIVRVYLDVAEMRASGKTAAEVKETVIKRIHDGVYKAPARGGISYMLAPIMRGFTGNPGVETVMTMSMPHFMFYAPYVTEANAGLVPNSQVEPWLVNPGNTVLGDGKGPFGFLIMAANPDATAKILADSKELLKRLADYSPYFKMDASAMNH